MNKETKLIYMVMSLTILISFALGLLAMDSIKQMPEPKIKFKYINTTEFKYIDNCSTTKIIEDVKTTITKPSKYNDMPFTKINEIPKQDNIPIAENINIVENVKTKIINII